LDHEQHDTSENRETANADMDQVILRLVGGCFYPARHPVSSATA
jgi:hypothetical protein